MKSSVLWCLLIVMAIAPAIAADTPWFGGDLLLSLSNGDLGVYRSSDGTRVGTVHATTDGQAKGMAFDTSRNLYVTHWYGTGFSGNTVVKYDSAGNLLGEWGSRYDCNPTSIVFDSSGKVYVGQADCSGDVLKFDANGNPLAAFDVAPEHRGSAHIALLPDNCRLLYTSAGNNVKQFDVCANTQLANFNQSPLSDTSNGANQLAVLPGGGLLVADMSVIERLDASGFRTALYDAAGENCFLGLALDPDHTTFWASSWCNSMIYHFNLTTGALLGSFGSGTDHFTVKSLIRIPPPHVTPPPPPPPENQNGRMTGGGSIFTSEGMRVTHGFELHCNASDMPNRLEINWRHHQFHLLNLTSVACTDDPNIDPGNPKTNFDTLTATGTGRLDGTDGATIQLKLTDAGEPGRNDTATFIIRDASGNVVLTVSGPLHFGNHQAHGMK